MILTLLKDGIDRRAGIFLGAIAGAALVVAILNLGLPASSPLHVPNHVVALLGKYLCYAVLAL